MFGGTQAQRDAFREQKEEWASLRGHKSCGFYVRPLKSDQHFCGLPVRVYKLFSSLIITRIYRKQEQLPSMNFTMLK